MPPPTDASTNEKEKAKEERAEKNTPLTESPRAPKSQRGCWHTGQQGKPPAVGGVENVVFDENSNFHYSKTKARFTSAFLLLLCSPLRVSFKFGVLVDPFSHI